MPNEKRRVQVWLPAELVDTLEALAKASDRNLTQEIARALRRYVASHKRQKEEDGESGS
jgi:metal-responsive CopG/Arc/MetJ family transcriptional regulator